MHPARQTAREKRQEDVKSVLLKLNYDAEKPADWTNEQLRKFCNELRHLTKPMIIAANKIDKPAAKENIERLKKAYPNIMIVPCSADAELALREANKAGLIEYMPGESEFEVLKQLNEKQRQAPDVIKKNVIDAYGSTGVQDVLNRAVFELLKYIAVFPAGASKLADSKGNILPDCFLVPSGTTALDFAYRLHTDIGKGFINAVNAKTKQVVGKEYKLKHRDGIEIMTR